MYNAHKLARIWNMKIVYVDEAVFTFNTFRSKAWSQKNTSIRVQESAIKVKTMALIAAISEDGGLEAYSLHPKSIKTEEFVAFVEKLSAKFEKRDFAIFLDNL
jgi:dsRNA-specific ribonuclease